MDSFIKELREQELIKAFDARLTFKDGTEIRA